MIKKYPHIIKLVTDIDPKNGAEWAQDSLEKYVRFKSHIFRLKFDTRQFSAWTLFANTINHLYRNRHAKNQTRPGPR